MRLVQLAENYAQQYSEQEISVATCNEIIQLCRNTALSDEQKQRHIEKIFAISDMLFDLQSSRENFADAVNFLNSLITKN